MCNKLLNTNFRFPTLNPLHDALQDVVINGRTFATSYVATSPRPWEHSHYSSTSSLNSIKQAKDSDNSSIHGSVNSIDVSPGGPVSFNVDPITGARSRHHSGSAAIGRQQGEGALQEAVILHPRLKEIGKHKRLSNPFDDTPFTFMGDSYLDETSETNGQNEHNNYKADPDDDQ